MRRFDVRVLLLIGIPVFVTGTFTGVLSVQAGDEEVELETYEANKDPSEVTVLRRAFAHNDYAHDRPLFDALDRGFSFVEADLFLRDGRLLVAHHPGGIDPARTLEGLYLQPLKERVEKVGGDVYPDNPHQFWLMLDLKSDGDELWPHLYETLEQYKDILAVVRDGEVKPGPVRVVISGDRPIEKMREQDPLYAGVDGRISDLDSDAPAWFMPWISDHWGTYFSWDGTGEMPEEERKKLARIVQLTHEDGRMLRFWHTPEEPALWRVLIEHDVDMIATDDLDGLQTFLQKRRNN